jgi:hypothetical protein
MRAALVVTAALVMVIGLAACGDSSTGVKAAKKADGKSWEGAGTTFAASGWKAGDKASWDEQMRTRAQSQNDYARAK